jgi:hypothetical protein
MSSSTAIFHLFVPIRTYTICEISRFDATNTTVFIAVTLYGRGIFNYYIIFNTKARET